VSDLGFLHAGAIDLALPGGSRQAVLRGLVDRLVAAFPGVGLDAAAVTRALLDREELGSTAIGAGFAVPHCKFRGVDRIIGVFGRTATALDFDARDRQPVRGFFLVVSPMDASGSHIRVLAAISRVVRDPGARQRLIDSPDPAAVLAAITG
jgi:PTS system nitrogen regulatory IIA component